MSEPAAARPHGAIPLVAASIPPLLAIFVDPQARSFASEGREIVVGLSLGADRSLAVSFERFVAPAAALLPIGALDHRVAILASIPAALATFLVARRVDQPSSLGAAAASAIALAFAAISAVLLAASPPSAAIAVLAIELLVARRERAASLACAFSLIAAPRLAPAVLVALLLVERSELRRVLVAIVPIATLFVATFFARSEAWLSLGRAFEGGALAPAATLLPSGALLRAAVVTFVLALFARLMTRSSPSIERAVSWIALATLACTFVLRAPGGVAAAAAVLAPIAAASAGALALAVDRHLARGGRRAVVALVPALSLGLSARAVEVEIASRRLTPSALAAHDAFALLTFGLAPPRAVVLVEDEAALLRIAHERVMHGLRPDVRVLPVQALLSSGATAMATRTMAAVPGANDVVRALLARGTLDPGDLAPLAQKVPVLSEIAPPRLRAVVKHASPTGGPLQLALERVDPSDRRIRRGLLDRRVGVLASGLALRPDDDRAKRFLRASAIRDARVFALAGDRDAALAALGRARLFGAPDATIARWTTLVSTKQTLEGEPDPD